MRIRLVATGGWIDAAGDDRPIHHLRHVADGSEKTYAHYASQTYPPFAMGGTWVFHDVHLVTHHLILVMAGVRASKRMLSQNLVVVLESPFPQGASREWARYLDPDHEEDLYETPQTTEPEVTYYRHGPPEPLVLDILESLLPTDVIRGDILIFLSCERVCQDLYHKILLSHELPTPWTHTVVTPITPSASDTPRILLCSCKNEGKRFADVRCVIDTGRAFFEDATTGMDWTEGYITTTMAKDRLLNVGKCFRLYDPASLSTDAFGTCNLKRSLVAADLLVRYGRTAFQGLPGGPWYPPSTYAVATCMRSCRVSEPLANLIQRGHKGMLLAAMIAHKMVIRRTSLQRNLKKIVTQGRETLRRWSRAISMSMTMVYPEETIQVSYDQASEWISEAFCRHTLVRKVYDKYIHVTSYDTVQFKGRPEHEHEYELLVYTHRQGDVISEVVPFHRQTSPPDAQLFEISYNIPVDLDAQPVPALRGAVVRVVHATPTKGSTVRVCGLEGVKSDILHTMEAWVADKRAETLDYPWKLKIDARGTTLLVTAGLEVTDAIPHNQRLPHIYISERVTTDIKGRRTRHGFEVTTRQDHRDAEQRYASHALLRPLTSERVDPKITSSISLVVRFYCIPSRGRAHIQADYVEQLKLPQGWVLETSPRGNHQIHGFPTNLDEYDLAAQLGIPNTGVAILRKQTSQGFGITPRQLPEGMQALLKTLSSHGHCALQNMATGNPEGCLEYTFRLDEETLRATLQYPTDILICDTYLQQPVRLLLRFHVFSDKQFTHAFHQHILLENKPEPRSRQLQQAEMFLQNMHSVRESLEPYTDWDPIYCWVDLADVELPRGITCDTASTEGPVVCLYGNTRDERRRFLQQLANVIHKTATTPTHPTWTTCPICLEDHAADYTLKACGCRLCSMCLARTVDASVYRCPTPTCRTRIAVDDLVCFLNPAKYTQIAQDLAEWYSLRRPKILWKCAGGCGTYHVADTDKDGLRTVLCTLCNQTWCVTCSLATKTPVHAHVGFCTATSDWDEIRDAARKAGIDACPTCDTPVDKGEGCYHVHCRAPRCNTHFCWGCMNAFSADGNSPDALARVVDVTPEQTILEIQPESWTTIGLLPLPARPVVVKTRYLPHDTAVGQVVSIPMYIYDHINSCARPVHP